MTEAEEPLIPHGFEENEEKISAIIKKFHGDFLQETENDTDTRVLSTVKQKVDLIHTSLMTFLSGWLNETSDCKTIDADADAIVNASLRNGDAHLRLSVKNLLISLCPYMTPWHPSMHPIVRGIFTKFSENTFSPQ